jgi:hypothetical protein
LLVGVSTLASRRFGEHAGGVVSAFPAIVGPVLLIAAHDHGAVFAARVASGTLLGLVALSGFAFAYARAALRAGWRTSLAAGWLAAAAIATVMAGVATGPLAAAAVAMASLFAAQRSLPRATLAPAPPTAPAWDLPVRMGLTAGLVVSLTAAGSRLGPGVGGVLAALPVLASILAVFTHVQHGAAGLAVLLRGMLSGMTGFAVFCLLVAVLIDRAGVGAAFALATCAAVAVQVAIARTSANSFAGSVVCLAQRREAPLHPK